MGYGFNADPVLRYLIIKKSVNKKSKQIRGSAPVRRAAVLGILFILFSFFIHLFMQGSILSSRTSEYDLKEGIRLSKKMSLMDFSNIMEMEKLIRRYFNSSSGTEVCLVDRTFTIRASNKNSLVGTTLKDAKLIQIFFSDNNEFKPYYVSEHSRYFPISRSGAVNLILLLKSQPRISDRDSSRYLHMALIVVLFLVFGCLALIIHLFKRKAVIKSMSGTVEAVLQGKFEKRLSNSGNSEFAYLTNNFNMVIERLEEQVRDYENINKELRILNREKDEYALEIQSFNLRLKNEVKMATADLAAANKELDKKYSELFKLEVFNQGLLSSVPSGIIATGRNGEISYINNLACKMLNLEAEKVVNTNYMEALAFSTELTEFLENSDLSSEERVISFSRNGKKIVLCVKTQRLQDLHNLRIFAENVNIDYDEVSNNIPGVVAVISDITETTRLRDEATRNKSLASLGQLAAGVAHEIRNPLSAINGFAELLKRNSKGDEKAARYVARILGEVKQLDNLVSNVLDFAKPNIPNYTLCDPVNIVAEAVEIIVAGNKMNSVEFSISLPDLPADIYLDKNQIRQVLINIIGNASQACAENGNVEIKSSVSDNETFSIIISDNGKGMNTYEIENLFNPFFTTKEEGTGLGLSICYKIMQYHGASIDVESVQGSGSTFTLTFPINHNEPAQAYIK